MDILVQKGRGTGLPLEEEKSSSCGCVDAGVAGSVCLQVPSAAAVVMYCCPTLRGQHRWMVTTVAPGTVWPATQRGTRVLILLWDSLMFGRVLKRS